MTKSRSLYFLYKASRPLYWGVKPLQSPSKNARNEDNER